MDTGSASLSGTSMACPHVSGAAAIILDADPSMKPSAVLDQMLGTAYQNVLSGLKFDDTNSLLCVTEGGAPQPEPTPAPAPGTWVVGGRGWAIASRAATILEITAPMSSATFSSTVTSTSRSRH